MALSNTMAFVSVSEKVTLAVLTSKSLAYRRARAAFPFSVQSCVAGGGEHRPTRSFGGPGCFHPLAPPFVASNPSTDASLLSGPVGREQEDSCRTRLGPGLQEARIPPPAFRWPRGPLRCGGLQVAGPVSPPRGSRLGEHLPGLGLCHHT